MPDLLITLRQQLNEAGERAVARYQWDEGEAMRRALARIEHTFDAPGLAGVAEDAIPRSLESVRRAGRAKSFKDLKYACFGCTLPLPGDGWRLIEDALRFPRVLEQVDQQRDEPRRLRRCYQGLMLGYFEYAGGSTDNRAGRKNWQNLRAFLNDRLPLICTAPPAPEWTAVLIEHRGLFSTTPCARYGAALVEGRREEVDQLRKTLGITEHSWFLTELVMAQIEAAAALGEARFAELLPALLDAIEPYETLRDRGLARLIEIYATRRDRLERADLRDTAVGRWGNPWLEKNRPSWGRVSDEARLMVAGWLNRQLVKDFFELLADDGATDRRRLNYWLRYADDHITGIWFALGSQARQRAHHDPDFKKVIRRMQGLRLDLDAGGASANNAFIMRIGDVTVVEFGTKGNACYLYDTSTLPFSLDQAWVYGDRRGLKHDSRRARLLHMDARGQSWEQHFDAAIFQSATRNPPPVTRPAPGATPRTDDPPRRQAPRPTAPQAAFSEADFQRFTQAWDLPVQDRRAIGGALWVNTHDSNPYVCEKLQEWGFRYKTERGWWRG